MAERKVPRIRFRGFEEDWEQRKLGEMAVISTGYPFNSNEFSPEGKYLVITNGNIQDSFTNVDESVGNRITLLDRKILDSYILDIGDILITMDGTVGRTAKVAGNGLILAQRVGRVKPVGNTEFMYQALSTGDFSKAMTELSHGGTIKHISLNEISLFEFKSPVREREQNTVGKFLYLFDSLLSLHQRKLEKLKILKKAMLEKMFPKNGAKVPKIRFSGFTDDWEQRKFSELVLIERGGSPRPIDNYITDAPDGLNWVKIGDAPAQGRYIFKTAEKIRPQGLSKTRQVQPGDLILSNSMSFGKPYIMGIHGCIHDGWLLIRDTGAKFDSKFLCHLLGSNQMLEQYRMFAAGSTVNNLNKELVGNTTVHIPVIQEQRVIGESLESIDKCISLHQRKLEKLRQIKKSMLERMFV